jgi:hypothetical protein
MAVAQGVGVHRLAAAHERVERPQPVQHAVAHREEAEHVARLREVGRAVDDLRFDALLSQQRAQGQSGDARACDQNPHPFSLPDDLLPRYALPHRSLGIALRVSACRSKPDRTLVSGPHHALPGQISLAIAET